MIGVPDKMVSACIIRWAMLSQEVSPGSHSSGGPLHCLLYATTDSHYSQ